MIDFQFTEGTICAPATIPGTGAISIIRVSGKEALTIADKIIRVSGTPMAETDGYRLRYGTVFGAGGEVLDNVVVSVFRVPHSYTGENSVEISCHASKYIVNEILSQLIAAGARIAAPGEFTRRAFINGKMDLAQAEAVADVIASQSAAAHRVAMNQLKGGFSKELKSLRDKLLKMTSLLELELDFSEEDVEFASREELVALVDETLSHIGRLTDSFSRGNAIKNGVPVAIIGATNTGKSTLLNALLGEERAIVSDVAGTTRDTIEETLNIGGVLFRFIDTAGIRETDEVVERIGIERTFKKLGEAAVVLGMTDLSRGEDAALADAEYIWNKMAEAQKINEGGSGKDGRRMILLLNKCDKVNVISDGEQAFDGSGKVSGGHSDVALAGRKSDAEMAGNMDVIRINNIVSALHNKDIDIEPVLISAKDGSGLADLKARLSEIGSELTGSTDETLVTNARHYEALVNAATALKRVREGLGCSPSAKPLSEGMPAAPESFSEEAPSIAESFSGKTPVTSNSFSNILPESRSQLLPPDLVAQDLREVLYHLGSIVGEITTDEILGNIFRNFCVGK